MWQRKEERWAQTWLCWDEAVGGNLEKKRYNGKGLGYQVEVVDVGAFSLVFDSRTHKERLRNGKEWKSVELFRIKEKELEKALQESYK